MKNLLIGLATGFALGFGTLWVPETLTHWNDGKVVAVKDGDTIEILEGKETRTIRLLNLDAPEKGQAFGDKAKKRLSDLCFGKRVQITNEKPDPYGRTVATVEAPWFFFWKKNVNETLVKEGLAWSYTKYSRKADQEKFTELEETARKKQEGIWSQKTPVPPWDYRKK